MGTSKERFYYPKYITLYDTEGEFVQASKDFEEVNWSDVAYPPERPDSYRLSRRLSYMYKKDTPPDYKFSGVNDGVTEDKKVLKKIDGEWKVVTEQVTTYPDAHKLATYRLLDYSTNCIRKTFFLEIVWGYSGWEWNNYEMVTGIDPETEEAITETLTGGNMYKIKDIQTVKHIIDGDRLEHINDFLNSQYNVNTIEGFDTSNLKAANRAFKRGTSMDTSYPKHYVSDIPTLYLQDAYDENNNLLNHYFGYGDTLANLVEADELFRNNKLYVLNNNPIIHLPNIKHIDMMYAQSVYTPGLQFKMENLEEFTNGFALTVFNEPIVNVNDILIDNTLSKVKDFNHMFYGASFQGYTEQSPLNIAKVQMDLTGSEVPNTEVINLDYLCAYAGPKECTYSGRTILDNSMLVVSLYLDHDVSLKWAFRNILADKISSVPAPYAYSGTGNPAQFWNRGFQLIDVRLNGGEQYVRSLLSAFINNTFSDNVPIQQVPNSDCDDTTIYYGCTFNTPVYYDFFNGNLTKRDSYGQFNNCTFNSSHQFSNIEVLDRVEFKNITIGENGDSNFNYYVQDQHQSNPVYRYFDMEGSKFTSITPQDIYIDTLRYMGVKNNKLNPFYNCSAFTDLSGIGLYYTSINDKVEVEVAKAQYSNFDFTGCKAMTNTPYIHYRYLRTGYLYSNNSFNGLTNLVEVNLEYYAYRGLYSGSTTTFKDCTNLRYLKIGYGYGDPTEADANDPTDIRGFAGTLDIRGCRSLDIPTLELTLNVHYGDLRIMRSTWDQLASAIQTLCNSRGTVTVVEDSSYYNE